MWLWGFQCTTSLNFWQVTDSFYLDVLWSPRLTSLLDSSPENKGWNLLPFRSLTKIAPEKLPSNPHRKGNRQPSSFQPPFFSGAFARCFNFRGWYPARDGSCFPSYPMKASPWKMPLGLEVWSGCREKIFLKTTAVIWGFPKIVIPQNGWFIMENPIKIGD